MKMIFYMSLKMGGIIHKNELLIIFYYDNDSELR